MKKENIILYIDVSNSDVPKGNVEEIHKCGIYYEDLVEKFGEDIKDTDINLEDYKNGVWAMWGVNKESNILECLEVGQSSNIASELAIDINYIKHLKLGDNSIRYNARRLFDFSKTFPVYSDFDRTKAKYYDIANNYKIIIVLIINQDNNRLKREEIEYKYAINHTAIYWNAWGPQRRLAREYYIK